MPDQLFIAVVFAGLLAGLVFTRYSPVWIFTSAMLACYLSGLVSSEDVLAKATNGGLVTLILLLLVSVGLEKMSWLRRLSGVLIGPGYLSSVFRLSAVTAVFSAFVNNTAVVATLTSTVNANRHHLPSKLLLPLSYAAILGGTTTLIGTSTNLIVSSFLEDVTGQGLQFFDFLLVGLAVSAAGLITMLLTTGLLPRHAQEDVDVTEYLVEAEVRPGSALIGRTIAENGLRDLESLFLVEVVRDEGLISPVAPNERIEAGDKLIFSGDISQVGTLDRYPGLVLFAAEQGLLRDNLTEVILRPGATVEGRTIKQSGFRSLFDAAVVGLRRGGRRLSGKLGSITLQAGDSLMLAVGPDFASRGNLDRNFIVVNRNALTPAPRGWQQWVVGGGMGAVVALAALGIVPLLKGLALLLCAMVLLGIVNANELRRRFPFDLWLIIASALTLSQALYNSGLVFAGADWLHEVLGRQGPLLALVGVYLLTLAMTEIMTNNAAAAIVFPVAYGLSVSFGVSPMPFVMAVAYGASASFLTPFGYTTNLMVQNIGRYRFADYTRYGLAVSAVYSLVVILLLPRIFPF